MKNTSTTLPASGVIFIGLMFFSVCHTYSQKTSLNSIPAMSEIRLFLAPDESSVVIATLKPGEALSPVADILAGDGIRWYLVRTKSGALGWMKQKNTDESKRIEKLFKALPAEPLHISTESSGDLGSRTISVPVEMDGTWIVVPVTFNRALRAHLQLDTGASVTMVSSRIANNLRLSTLGSRRGVTVGGIITVPTARVNSVNVGGAEVNDMVVSIHDFSPHPRIDGLLGMDFLKHFLVSLDTHRKLLILGPR